jgi:hypothetical protein
MKNRRSSSTSRHSAPNASSGRAPVPAMKITNAPPISSSSSAIASISSDDSNGSISRGFGTGFFTSTAGLSSTHFHRTACSSTWRSDRWQR